MTLEELGARLREARMARGMTEADVADRLKIPGRILHGVEEASDRLPRTVYVLYFIKDYIKLMGFSAEEATEWTASLEGFENLSRPSLTENQPFTPVRPSMLPVLLSAAFKAAVTALLAFALYSGYVYFFAGRDYEEVVKQPAQAQSEQAPKAGEAPAAPVWDAKEAAPAEEASVSQAPAAQPSAGEGAQPEAQAAPVWDVPAESPDEGPAVTQAMPSAAEDALPHSADSLVSQMMPAAEDPAPAEPAAQAVGTDAPAVLPEGMHHVEVIADGGDCWMGFEPDGRKQQRTLRKGDSFTMAFRDSLTVKLGHASAVRVIYDGKELERSASHRVVTLRFPPAE